MGDETKDLGTRISIKVIDYTSSHGVKGSPIRALLGRL